MTAFVSWIVELCRKNELVSEAMVPWLRYGLEKRLSTLISLIPFFILAILLTDIPAALCFVGSFCALRSCTNGYHAKTLLGCLAISLGTELILLLGLYPLFSVISANITSAVCLLLLILLAPYNHPNIHFTKDEIKSLKNIIMRRAILLECILLIAGLLQVESVVKGIFMGITMTTLMICLAYLLEWRKQNESASKSSQNHCS